MIPVGARGGSLLFPVVHPGGSNRRILVDPSDGYCWIHMAIIRLFHFQFGSGIFQTGNEIVLLTPFGSYNSHHSDPPGSTAWIHQDAPLGITKIHPWHPPGALTGINQDLPLGSRAWINKDPHVDTPGPTTSIHNLDPCRVTT